MVPNRLKVMAVVKANNTYFGNYFFYKKLQRVISKYRVISVDFNDL